MWSVPDTDQRRWLALVYAESDALAVPLSAAPSLPATSLIFVSFLRRDSTQKSPQKIGSGYNAILSSPDQD
jgi:hypothetical protein